MTKVSKNIKRLRTERGMTQDALAEKLFVSRQAVSGWENNRTQPDIETLDALAKVFEVEIEELIYGQKRKTQESEKIASHKIITVIFAVLGSLMLGIGIAILFIHLWIDLPQSVQTIFSVIPMLLGQAAALFVYLKKKNSVAWCEGAAIAWCSGCAATVAMIDAVFYLNSDFTDCFFIDSLLFLPAIFLLNAAAPLAVYYFAVIYYGFVMLDATENPLYLLLISVMIFIGSIYCIRKRSEKTDLRFIYSVWLTVFAVLITAIICGLSVGFGLFPMLSVCFVSLYAFEKDGSEITAFRHFGMLGASVMSVIHGIMLHPDIYDSHSKIEQTSLIGLFVSVAVAVSVIFSSRSSFAKNKIKTVFCATAVLCAAFAFIGEIAPVRDSFIIYVPAAVSALVQAASLIFEGAKQNRFTPLNVGILMIFALLWSFAIAAGFDIVGYSIMCIILGSVFLSVNFFTAKKIRRQKQEQEADYNEK